ncbi:STAS/SEC14 domain-containing protein [Methylophaga thiooxydans]|uniref:STAS/SEC14 domain-containing protein n=1 Tax=Methylophaga thiooxydans TaxID=392484 RepID=UPI002356D544|nr:STAS/SEC14 domain-containing protein [Methylophaga thiooxydans]
MEIQRHGLSVGIDRIEDKFFITFRIVGKLTHDDYAAITPMIAAALSSVEDPEANVLIDATEFEGWELRAAWDDFKLGLKHGSDFYKIAIVGDKRWQQWAAKIGSWFISGEAKHFDNLADALSWLNDE